MSLGNIMPVNWLDPHPLNCTRSPRTFYEYIEIGGQVTHCLIFVNYSPQRINKLWAFFSQRKKITIFDSLPGTGGRCSGQLEQRGLACPRGQWVTVGHNRAFPAWLSRARWLIPSWGNCVEIGHVSRCRQACRVTDKGRPRFKYSSHRYSHEHAWSLENFWQLRPGLGVRLRVSDQNVEHARRKPSTNCKWRCFCCH